MAFQERYGEIRRRIVQIILAVLIAPLCVVSIAPASADVFYEALSLDAPTDLVSSLIEKLIPLILLNPVSVIKRPGIPKSTRNRYPGISEAIIRY